MTYKKCIKRERLIAEALLVTLPAADNLYISYSMVKLIKEIERNRTK